ncbi:bifunctional 5,10-methylenetetrahydrofolate dehydrogenase/5,10-methenyltetrahydrofolate cyclohydrolase [Deinococcus cellulosilyticus]|uniref:Bifunctional protein FolD n=1 Tax=Deinococcus cellulosilyticus (strain DSM 18568 / NBRC 106333 / KACC 11606 / 5516J-15) TaxID=1223518 RepID=A0A511MZU4_DEIC1|nr:tetrahydrofolate dehydrogenase/cyclohydrolase catalytic domain-containing protein [Deinococcus cellulosilyticus]GEM46069.1 bifunctional protein FolD [Deinococcus cellulosilyticus NBRC 106333 = KACC 11606]
MIELKGAPAAESLLRQAVQRMEQLPFVPHLHVIRLGEDPASVSYVRLKDRKAQEIGLRSTMHVLPEDTSEAALLALIDRLNASEDAHGILVQLPLPKHINAQKVIEHTSPLKDVDGFHPENVGKLWLGQEALLPCTPAGILALCDHHQISLAGKKVVIVGRSNIVGKPLAALMLSRDATVTVAHSRTVNLPEITLQADILVAAVGRPGTITPVMVKEGAVVLDVGVNRVDGKLVGDVTPEVRNVASALTPVPGGIGPMTVAQLMLNTVLAAERQRG